MNSHERVILLHGILRTRRSMAGLAGHLVRHGYAALNLSYPSRAQSLHDLVAFIAARIPDEDATTHLVGYSMGGLLIRAYLAQHRPKRLGRVVMLGTPNQGSEVADALQHLWVYKRLCGPAGQQLITDQTAFREALGSVDYELGVVAGSRSFDPIGSWIIGQANDGKVSVESTKLPGMKDHIVIPAAHTFLASHRLAWTLTARFLETGRFGSAE